MTDIEMLRGQTRCDQLKADYTDQLYNMLKDADEETLQSVIDQLHELNAKLLSLQPHIGVETAALALGCYEVGLILARVLLEDEEKPSV